MSWIAGFPRNIGPNRLVNPDPEGPGAIQVKEVDISNAQFLGMYETPVEVLPPAPAGHCYLVLGAWLTMTYGGIASTGGGDATLQYGDTPHGAGAADASIPALLGAAALNASTSSVLGGFFSGSFSAIQDFVDIVEMGVYFTNHTAAFATGNSTYRWHLVYTLLRIE